MESLADELEDPPADVAFRDDDVIMEEEADELSHPDSYYDTQDRDDELDLNTKNGSNNYAQNGYDSENSLENKSRSGRSSRSHPQVKSRLFPIEVVLKPPPDPSEYQKIESSQTVERILDEIELDGELFYSVEFYDGHIEQVAYDDMLEMENGRRAAQRYQERRLSLDSATQSRAVSKRPLPEDDYEESESDDSDRFMKKQKRSAQPTRRSRRQASKPVPVKRHEIQGESEDELAQNLPTNQDEDGDMIPLIRSDISGAVRTSSRRRRQPKRASYTSSLHLDIDSDIEFEKPSRRSTRANRPSKSMRDPEIDDEYEAVEDKSSAPKVAAVKETFEDIPEGSAFRKVHCGVCDTCNTGTDYGKGQLIFCQGCSYSYHKVCIGFRSHREHRVTKVSPNHFVLQCRFCIRSQKKDQRAPDYSMCQTCKLNGISCPEFSAKKTTKQEEKARRDNGGIDPITDVQPNLLNNADNVLFRCSTCKRAYHFEHLPPIASDHVNGINVRDERVAEYSLARWKCRECQETAHKIQTLVAWRPADRTTPKELLADAFTSDEIEYLVKWEGQSHYHDSWMPGAWVYGIVAATTRISFHKREENMMPKMTIEDAVEKEWLLADVLLDVKFKHNSSASSKASKSGDLARITDIESVYVKFQGLSYEEAVWDEPPPDLNDFWVAFRAAYEEYLNGKYFPKDDGMRERIKHYRSLDFKKECELQDQPPSLKKDRTLMKYQIEGVNWLLYHFQQQMNVILADEMGLGKTIQIVSFIASLVLDQPKCWPFLIVVPNATCANWRRELKDWAPGLRVVAYHGGKAAQDLAYTYELFPHGLKAGMKAHVVIMSYEAASNLKGAFHSVKWAGLIVDEGQRLKNEQTQLYKSLVDLDIPCRILLTGTPLQNNKRELFNLLQFIDPRHNAEWLDTKYAVLTKDNLPELHNLIRPYFLRRTKAQVLRFLPAMAQVIVPVTMTVLQEKLCRSIMSRNAQLIKAIISKETVKASDRTNLSNIVADLRQCLCHPFCFNGAVEETNVDDEQKRRNLIEASPKFKLLEIMLPKLQERGHRVLIFSQFLRCLDILEDFLTDLGLPYGRIDGKQNTLEKQKRIDAFNAPDSPLFAMLLSTRAGGVGINLATADTVIIYDPDWNPHQDIQAISRAHRIGQKNKVLCVQLTTKDTVEENILQAGMKKMALDRALIETLDAQDEAGHDLESILRRGAEALFSERDKAKITYDSASVDKLLDRSRFDNPPADGQATSENQFSFARVWDNDSSELTGNDNTISDDEAKPADASVWENILKARQEEHERELAAEKEVLGRGKRRRSAKVNYSNGRPEPDSAGSDVEDELYIDNGVEDDEDDEDEPYQGEGQVMAPGKGKANRAKEQNRAPQHLNPPAPRVSSSSYTSRPAEAPTPPLRPPSQQVRGTLPQLPSNIPAPMQPPALRWKPLTPIPSHAPILTQSPMVKSTQTTAIPSHVPTLTQPPKMVKSTQATAVPSYVPTLTQPPKVKSMQPTTVPSHVPTLAQPPKVVKSTQTSTVPSHAHTLNQPPKVKSTQTTTTPSTLNPPISNPPIWSIGVGGVCLVCKRQHSVVNSCINFNSEISLRIAIDSLRTEADSPHVRTIRDMLVNQLRKIAAR
ncbi:PHD/FYVE-zinc-finger like domain-containing protein [Hypoxylon sp. FL0890]|nr:PHD/FYVE-zinc-finger like domain-containing protein [Hypoxylon sp. FL0890]